MSKKKRDSRVRVNAKKLFGYLRSLGRIDLQHQGYDKIAEFLENLVKQRGLDQGPFRLGINKRAKRARIVSALDLLRPLPFVAATSQLGGKPRTGKTSARDALVFYQSYEWRRLRYQTLLQQGRKCACCQTSEGEMHVDHIKPLRLFWHLRLDPKNVQVLCRECNHGKGNWDQTDWRKPAKARPRLHVVR